MDIIELLWRSLDKETSKTNTIERLQAHDNDNRSSWEEKKEILSSEFEFVVYTEKMRQYERGKEIEILADHK